MQLLWLLILTCPCALGKKGRWKVRQGRVQSDVTTGQTQALINTDSPAHVTSKNFISLTLDPFLIRDLPWADPQTLKLAKMLSPAWFKIAPTTGVLEYDDFNFTMFQWAAVTHFTSESGMTQLWDAGIFAKAAENWKKSMRGGELEDTVAAPGTVHDFPPLLNQIGFVMKKTDLDKIDMIKEIFPKYDSPGLQVYGPEVEFFNNYSDVKNFSTWLSQNVENLNAITYRPSPHVKTGNSSLASILGKEASDLFKLELLVLQGTFDQLGLASKPVMISDARFHWDDVEATQIYKNTFGLTLLWAERLGIAAANGIQAVFQPNLLPLHERGIRLQPSPDFWFAAVHKKLVGDRVLNLRSQANGDPKCSLFAYCTQTGGPENYPPGAVTVMGINMGDVELFGNITNGSDENASRDLHHYLLTGNIDESKIFLNGEELNADYESNPIPRLNFSILPHASPLIMPPHSISFWVLPDAKAAACMAGEPPTRKRRSILDDDPDTTHLAVVFPVEHVRSAKEDEDKETCAKGKRCHLNKKKLDGTPENTEASDCPDGCYPANHLGGCGLRGLKIMAPGCSTQQVLERLIYITNQRKSGCCCDGAGNCGDEAKPETDGRSDSSKDKPQVEITTADYYTTPQNIEAKSDYYPETVSTLSADDSTNAQYTTPSIQPDDYNPQMPVNYRPKKPQPPPKLPVSYGPPNLQPTPQQPETTSHAPLSRTTYKPTSRFTFYYNPALKRFVTEYITDPTSTPRRPSTKITTTTTTPSPSTPEEEEENSRSDNNNQPPVVEIETTVTTPKSVPTFDLRRPYRFQGHFNGLIHPFDHDLPAGCIEAHQTGFAYPIPDCSHPSGQSYLDEPSALKDYSNLGYHPEPQPLLQNFYYPAEQEDVTSSPSRRCSESGQPDCPDEDPALEKSLDQISAEGNSTSKEDFIRSQQVLQELQGLVDTDQQQELKDSVEKDQLQEVQEKDQQVQQEFKDSVEKNQQQELKDLVVKDQQQVLQLEDLVEKELILNSAREEESAEPDCKGCDQTSQGLKKMSNKIKTALAVLNWLKDDSKGR